MGMQALCRLGVLDAVHGAVHLARGTASMDACCLVGPAHSRKTACHVSGAMIDSLSPVAVPVVAMVCAGLLLRLHWVQMR